MLDWILSSSNDERAPQNGESDVETSALFEAIHRSQAVIEFEPDGTLFESDNPSGRSQKAGSQRVGEGLEHGGFDLRFPVRFLVASLMLVLTLPWTGLAQHASSSRSEAPRQAKRSSVDKPDGENEGESGAHAQTHAPRHISVFMGGTSAEGHQDFTFGMEATHRLPLAPNRLSVGALADVAVHEGESTLVAGAGLFAHPLQQGRFRALKLLAVPAVESHGDHQKFLFRTGVGYDLHLGHFTLTPTLNFDFVDGHVAEVFGVSAGIGF